MTAVSPGAAGLFHPVLPTGETIWTLNSIHLSSGILAAPAATLPDVDGDGIRDIVVLALKETQVQYIPPQDLKGTSLSQGRTGILMWKGCNMSCKSVIFIPLDFTLKAPFFFQ